jgi:hypothetical protein
MIKIVTMTKKNANNYNQKKERIRTTKINIMTTIRKITNSCKLRENKRKTTIKMATITKRIANNYNLKGKKMKSMKIKITTKRIANSYNQ